MSYNSFMVFITKEEYVPGGFQGYFYESFLRTFRGSGDMAVW